MEVINLASLTSLLLNFLFTYGFGHHSFILHFFLTLYTHQHIFNDTLTFFFFFSNKSNPKKKISSLRIQYSNYYSIVRSTLEGE